MKKKLEGGEKVTELEKERVRILDLPFIVILSAEVQVNGLGELVTVHVKDGELRAKPDLSREVLSIIGNDSKRLMRAVLEQAQLNMMPKDEGDAVIRAAKMGQEKTGTARAVRALVPDPSINYSLDDGVGGGLPHQKEDTLSQVENPAAYYDGDTIPDDEKI